MAGPVDRQSRRQTPVGGPARPRPAESRFAPPRPGAPRPGGPRPTPPHHFEAPQPPTDSAGLYQPGDEDLVAGRRPVEEAFVARRAALRLLIVPQRRQALERIILHATTLRIPIIEVEGGTLTALAGFDGHQGVALVTQPRSYADVDRILARAIERAEPALVLVLDSLEDPQNLGTLLRSAEAGGVHGVVFPTRRQAPLTPAAVKASAGATEHLLLAPVEDLAATLAGLQLRGLRIVGAEPEAALPARAADLRGPLAIVVGSEGHGLSPAVRRRCDLVVRIPLRGAIGSLNAAVAGSILLFEAVAQRDASHTGQPDAAASGAATSSNPATPSGPEEPAGEEVASPVDAVAPAVPDQDLLPDERPARPVGRRRRTTAGA
jgi:23S rRNA (guanosine2251-2'-O)-methyltransferase